MPKIRKNNTKKQRIIFWNIAFIMAIAISALFLVFQGKTLGAEVETIPETVTVEKDYRGGNLLGDSCPINSFQVSKVEGKENEYLYCLNHHLYLPGNHGTLPTLTKGTKLPRGLIAILESGFPYTKTFNGVTFNDDATAYFITEYAIWLYRWEHPNLFVSIDTRDHTLLTEEQRTGACLNESGTAEQNKIAAAIKWLADVGDAADRTEDSIKLNATTNKLTPTADKKYYQSGVINVTKTGKMNNYNIQISGVEGAKIINKTANSFQIQIPVTSVKNQNININVKAIGNFQSNKAYLYVSNPTSEDGKPPQNMTASIIERGTVESNINLSMTIEALAKMGFAKKDAITEEYVAGATFQLRHPDGTIEEITTQTEPVYIDDLLPGNYTLTETKAPDGYIINTTPKQFQIAAGQNVIVTSISDDYTRYSFLKRDTDGEVVVGAKLRIIEKGHPEKIIEEWTTTSTAHKIEKKLIVGKEYQLIEVEAPGGYLLQETPVTFTVTKDKNDQTIIMENEYTDIEIIKRDTDGAAVEGVVLKLVNAKGDTIDTWTTTTESHRIKKRLVVGEKYKIIEVSAPPGYLMIDKPQEFTVQKTSKLQTITVNNKYTKILISKIDANTNKPIYGVTFLIKDKDGKERYQFKIEKDICTVTDLESGKTTEEKTQNNACLIRKIPIGIYTLEEVEAPEGYVLNKTPITFEVRNDGNVQRIILKHNYTKLLIMGHSVTVDSLLVGITFQIRDSANQEVAKFKTNGKPYTVSNLPLGKYTIREVEVPDGFVLNKEPVEFEVTGDEHEVMLPNDFIKVQISKRDITNEKEVAGAKLEIRDSKGKLVDKWTSKESEEHLIERLKPGKYTLKETVVPKGYQAETTTIEFTVKETGDIQKVIMHNTPIVDVPDTKAGIPIVAYVLGGIIAVSGIGMIYINFIYRKKEKKI